MMLVWAPPDVKPHLLADVYVNPLLLLPPPLHPPGYGALVPVKTEEPVPVATVSSPPRALPPPRLCRQFWKSGDYVVARRNPDAVRPGRLSIGGISAPISAASSLSFDTSGGDGDQAE